MTNTGQVGYNDRNLVSLPQAEDPNNIAAPGTGADVPTDPCNLAGYRSAWGVRNFDGANLPPLTYQPFGKLSQTGVAAIRSRVQQLPPGGDNLILFRGQKGLGSLRRFPNAANARPKIEQTLRLAAQERARIRRDIERCRVFASLTPGLSAASDYDAALWRDATPIDSLVAYHQASYGCAALISCTRDLAVGAGNYNMRSSDNTNRYIYVLAVPKSAALNTFAMDRIRSRFSLQDGPAPTTGFSRDLEREITVWLDASPYVVGIYDSVAEGWVTSPNQGNPVVQHAPHCCSSTGRI